MYTQPYKSDVKNPLSNTAYTGYWCRATTPQQSSPYLFGGYYTSKTSNPVTKSMGCPHYFSLCLSWRTLTYALVVNTFLVPNIVLHLEDSTAVPLAIHMQRLTLQMQTLQVCGRANVHQVICQAWLLLVKVVRLTFA